MFPRADPADVRRRCEEAVLAALAEAAGPVRRQVLLARARELAAFSPEELAWAPTPGGRAHHPSLVEERLHWTLTNLKRSGLVENHERGWWSLARAPRGPERLAPPVSARRLEQLRAMPYAAYLRSSEWRRTREAAIALAGGRCQLDAAHDGTLHVHHSDYARRGEETTADLLVLCEDCHRRHHREHGRPGRMARATDEPAAAARPEGAMGADPMRRPARAAPAGTPRAPRRGGLRHRLRALLT